LFFVPQLAATIISEADPFVSTSSSLVVLVSSARAQQASKKLKQPKKKM